ncbi:MAG: diguanylate cyclase, partial [Gammaproteobacteria bacterium]|nr:diguanylate cyclase [Gammaproteobacteria bacterium]
MAQPLRLLLVFDTEAEARDVLDALASGGRAIAHRQVQDEAALLEALRFADWDAVVSAYRPAELSYASILRVLAADGRELPLILVAGAVGEELAVEAIKAGAQDCVSTDRLDRLETALAREIRDAEARRQRRRSDELLRYQACHDDLTGLLNRRTFMDRLHDTLVQVRRSRVPASLCFMDLDRFKQVNDRCGHRAGDELLRQLASLMRQQVRESDTLARLGGDEFGLLLRDCATDQAVRVARELADRIRAFRFGWREHVFDVGISVGIAAVSPEASTAAELLGAADMACYAAKAEGEGAIRCYHPDDAAMAAPRGELRSLPALETALDGGAFVLVTQPVVELRDGAAAPLGQEVLLRMRGPDQQLASPAAFLPVAERNGLLPTIDRWVVRTVLARLGTRLRHDGADVPPLCFLNLSGASLQEPALVEFIREEITRAGVPPERLCFEVSETA